MHPARTEVLPSGFTADITHPAWPPATGDLRVDDAVRIEVTVLTETLTVALGIRARAVHTQVVSDGVLVADTLEWYAQDTAGNVWALGRQALGYAEGRIVSTAGSWEAGFDDAAPRIVLAAGVREPDTFRATARAGAGRREDHRPQWREVRFPGGGPCEGSTGNPSWGRESSRCSSPAE